MSRDPGSVWKPLPEAGAPDGKLKNKFIVHSTGSNGTAFGIWNYFAQAGVVNESTFIVGVGPHDPTLQIMDSTDIADANVAANDEGISVEVVGDGRGGFNAWQRSELIRLGAWSAKVHPIRPQIVPSPAQEASGFGWHIMFGSPGPWTAVSKVCPGEQRIRELKADIFPAIFKAVLTGIILEEDVPLTDVEINAIADRLANRVVGGTATKPVHAWEAWRDAAKPAAAAVNVDATTLANALANNGAFAAALAKAVNDDAAKRLAS